MSDLTTIYVVRHAQSKANAGDYTDAESVIESPLSKLGINQSKELVKSLKDIRLDAIFSSDLIRAIQTAEFLAKDKKLEVKTSNLIRERSYHSYWDIYGGNEEKFIKSMEKELKNLSDEEKMQFKLNPDMESAEEGAIRLLNFIKEVSAEYSNKKIVVFCHGNIMRSLLTYLGYAKFDELPNGSIHNTGYFVLSESNSNFEVIKTNKITVQKNTIRNF